MLGLCAEAGLIGVGVIAIDGTKVHANAFAVFPESGCHRPQHATRDYEQIAREILDEAD